MSTNLATIASDIEVARPAFLRIADPGQSFEAEAGFAMQILERNEYAAKTALQNRQSVVDAVTNIAAIGISLNPARAQAYLVPRDGRICLDISYKGLMDLSMQAGSIQWVQCALVYANDQFALRGIDKQPHHEFDPFAKDRGELVGVYCTAKTTGGDYLTHTMSIADVYAIRDKTQSWQAYQSKKVRSCPWADHEGEMVKKTCVKQASKYWPRGAGSSKLEKAIEYANTAGGEGIVIENQPAGIKPTDGPLEEADRQTQNYLRELAEELKTIHAMDDAGKVLDRVQAEKLDNELTIALWALLPSDMRAALKKEKAAREEAAKVLAA